MIFVFHLFLIVVGVKNAESYSSIFDHSLYESAINSTKCDEQLVFLTNDSLGLNFLDASAKIPSGIFTGNLVDLGDFFECLNINEIRDEMEIQGKYCIIKVPMEQNPIQIPEDGVPIVPWPNRNNTRDIEDFLEGFEDTFLGIDNFKRNQRGMGVSSPLENSMSLAMCIPKVCTVRQAVDFYIDNLIFLNVTYRESFCRLPNDKLYAPADYITLVALMVIGLITVLSTSYDLFYVFITKREADIVLRSFSIYTNTRRFLSFTPAPGSLDCLDGIRSISMMWVVIGHCFAFSFYGHISNLSDVLIWMQSFSSVWITSAPITVDTFFLLSGVLCVYTTIEKISRHVFIRNIHLFYLNRLLRMFPLLAIVVLLQSSWINHASDGPNWPMVGSQVEVCRKWWWSTLLHVQNYVNSKEICLGQSWYLSVDVQLYILAPLVIVWLFGRRLYAWIALIVAILLSLASSTAYSFHYNFTGSILSGRLSELESYMVNYYYNTLTRAPPFFVGMFFGYCLQVTKGRILLISNYLCTSLWILSFAMMSLAIFPIYKMQQFDYDNQMFNNFFNAYVRAIWAAALGWIIFACMHGYGGPINWFLSLPMWRLPARLSYAVYLVHYPIIMIANGSWVNTHHFSTGDVVYRFLSDLTLSVIVSFVLCIVVDAPFSTLQKQLIGKGAKEVKAESQESVLRNSSNEEKLV